jgi:hypothetical protein
MLSIFGPQHHKKEKENPSCSVKTQQNKTSTVCHFLTHTHTALAQHFENPLAGTTAVHR